MKNLTSNNHIKPLNIAGLVVDNITAQKILRGISVSLYRLNNEKNGLIGFMFYTKSHVSLSNLYVSDELLPVYLQLSKKEKKQIYHTMSKIMLSDYAQIVLNESVKNKSKDEAARYYEVSQVLINNFEDYIDEWNRHLDFLLMNSTAFKSNKYSNNQ